MALFDTQVSKTEAHRVDKPYSPQAVSKAVSCLLLEYSYRSAWNVYPPVSTWLVPIYFHGLTQSSCLCGWVQCPAFTDVKISNLVPTTLHFIYLFAYLCILLSSWLTDTLRMAVALTYSR